MRKLIYLITLLFLTRPVFALDQASLLDIANKLFGHKDYTTAIKIYKDLSNQGYAAAQFHLGMTYANGIEIKQDYHQAVFWYRKAADQGYARAQYNLGAMHAKGKGVRKDNKTAKEWYGKSCDNGNQFGCDLYRELHEKENNK